jgi:hypothetical protein
MGFERGSKLERGQRRGVVEHSKCLDKAPIEEDSRRLRRVSVILLGVAPKNLPRECGRLRTWALAARPTFRNDRPG